MKLFQLTSPNITTPTYCVGRDVARLVKLNAGAVDASTSIKEVPHPPAPAGCESVEVRGFRLEFLPQTRTMVADRLLKAERGPGGFFYVRDDRSCLCMSAFVRAQLLRKLTGTTLIDGT